MATVLTLNAFLLDIRLFGLVRVYPAAPHLGPRLAALPEALADTGADVICLQEVFRRPHRRLLAERLGGAYPECAGVRHPGRPLGTGLMVLSRHPIESARPIEFRAAFFEERLVIRMGMLDCVVRFPDLGPVRVINAHLAAGGLMGDPESPGAETIRGRQVAELLARAGDDSGPATVILAGDMNAGPEASATNYRQILEAGYRDTCTEARAGGANGGADGLGGGPAATWDPANPLIAGARTRSSPPQRIDHVFLRREGSEALVPREGRVVLRETRATVAGDRTVPVSDHYGVMVRIDQSG